MSIKIKDDKIDFVILTVDGNDPVWRKKKNSYLGIDEGDDRDIRYRDWENLQYLFRGIEEFTPWVNKVFLVTDHQPPKWINKDHEKLVLVNHDEFIPEKYLPTFSSHPIEHNLFRIKGLSEQFVYFNDDTFIMKELEPTDFFKDGLPCDFPVEVPLLAHDMMFSHTIINNMLLVNRNFKRNSTLRKQKRKFYSRKNKSGRLQNKRLKKLKTNRFFGFKNYHMPNPFLKSSMKAVWELNYNILDETCCNKFRSDNDVNQYIYSHYQYVTGKFMPYDWKNRRHLYRCNDRKVKGIAKAIRKRRWAMVCINEADDLDFEMAKAVINDAWETILPEKSSFEL